MSSDESILTPEAIKLDAIGIVKHTDESEMTRKFLFCFPLRVGNIVLGYIILLISIAAVAYHLFELALCLVDKEDEQNHAKFKDFQNIEKIFGPSDVIMVKVVTMTYYLSYVIIGFLLFFFGIFLTCGAHKANHCLVTTFFVYSFFHLFLTIELIIFETLTSGWIQLGLILLSNLLLIICLFSVKYLMEAIRTGNIYSRPGEVYYKY